MGNGEREKSFEQSKAENSDLGYSEKQLDRMFDQGKSQGAVLFKSPPQKMVKSNKRG